MDKELFASCYKKQSQLNTLFASCSSNEEKYQKIIELGKKLPPFDPSQIMPPNLVQGCQSSMYIHTTMSEGKIFFSIYSEALISAGLAALLLFVYNDEPPETLLKVPATFLNDLGIYASLTPGRSNGLSSVYLRMKQEAIKQIISQNK